MSKPTQRKQMKKLARRKAIQTEKNQMRNKGLVMIPKRVMEQRKKQTALSQPATLALQLENMLNR